MTIVKYGKKKTLIFLLALIAMKNTGSIFIAYIINQFIDAADTRNIELFLRFAGIGIIGLVLYMIVGVVVVKIQNKYIRDVNLKIKTTVLEHTFVDSVQSDDVTDTLSFMMNDLKLLEKQGIEGELTILGLVIQFVLAVVAALFYDWATALVFLVGGLIPSIVSKKSEPRIMKASEKWTQSNSEYTNYLENTLNGIQTIKTYKVGDAFINLIEQRMRQSELSLEVMNGVVGVVQTVITTIAYIFGIVLPFGFGVYRVIHGNLTLGGFMAVVQLNNSILNPLIGVLNLRNSLKSTTHISTKIAEMVKEPMSRKIHSNVDMVSSLEVKEVSLKIDDKTLFSDISLDIRPGDNVLIMAPSGVGKTSFLTALLGMRTFTSGEYMINNKDAQMIDGDTLFEYFSYVNQAPYVFNESLEFNLTLGESVSKERFEATLKATELDTLVHEKGLSYVIENSGTNLSKGQIQRIEIARALLSNRPIMLADEMTAALDTETGQRIRKMLLKSDVTLIEVAHHISETEKMSYDHVLNLS
ncbi:ABC transporter ATP-binding protein [Erysipelothrix sp. HDW6C]|uniref:ATP-binding cassette domain-containing protein n=1 Tax=Erysipelothrix sp. HDW6C TaxID=2714930 RepID=UPI00140A60BA|nr:ABC transporter ATP-binding protein [Erysipelothrix sp. HDW6C]QIK69558.1 ABC transporter ATP-binding protein [Erysipelothrix sp. HDW6C]